MKNSKEYVTLIIISTFLLLSTTSCGTIMKTILGVPNLNVYSQAEINQHIANLPKGNNIIDAQLNPDLSEAEIKNFALMSVSYRTYIYDKNDSLMCYNGETYCSMVQLENIKNSTIEDSYVICDQTNMDSSIQKLLGDLTTITSKISLDGSQDLDTNQYKILIFMNTDIAKGELTSDWNYIYNSLKDNKNITFIRIWTDLNEDWGLKYGAKARLKVRKVKGEKKEYSMTLPKLPYEKK
ncbi:hypothetical protein SAMN05216480_110108 [Pustulibacterium marinum]|uniref:Lipoprotein n=1 Tax=Pustulibacterium marinum TaxID=1224947 RepID=A0A1I7HPU0_9FLAO|nr:hypothetical protein [Pustulibacterium marinum]SFU62671.1 hypothetical protein SAMN05216480_110108 [Pustulibacterium marinum]